MTRTDKIGLAVALALMIGATLLPLRDGPPLVTGGYVQAVTTESAVVAWTPRRACAAELSVECYGTHVCRLESAGVQPRHEFAFGGLAPGREYDWQLCSDGAVIDTGRFKTRSNTDDSPVRFAVIGDSGGQPRWMKLHRSPLVCDLDFASWMPMRSEPAAMGRALVAARPDFLLHVGDVVYPTGEQEYYRTGFFEPFGELLRDVCVYPVLGNHDVMVGDGEAFLANFVLPGDSDRNYSIVDGPLRIIAVDLNHHWLDPSHESLQFLRRELESATEPWILVANHYPVRSVYRERPRPDLVEHYVPLCREFGVDMILSGHDHLYQRFGKPGEMIEVVTGGGGKNLYEIRHRPEGTEAAVLAFHYCAVEVFGPQLRLTAKSLDGDVIDQFVIDKREQLARGTVRGRAERTARLRACN